MTFIKQLINYEDFIFFLCKLVLSKYWIFKRTRLNEIKSTVEDEINEINGLANANKLLEIEKKNEIEKKLEEEREKEKEMKEKKNDEKDRKKSGSGERKIEKKDKDEDRPKSPAKRTAAQIKLDAELVLQVGILLCIYIVRYDLYGAKCFSYIMPISSFAFLSLPILLPYISSPEHSPLHLPIF